MTKLQNLFNDFNDYKAFQEHYYNYNKSHIISENFADALLWISWDGIADQIEEQVKPDNIGKQIHIIGTWFTNGKWVHTNTFVGILSDNLKFQLAKGPERFRAFLVTKIKEAHHDPHPIILISRLSHSKLFQHF